MNSSLLRILSNSYSCIISYHILADSDSVVVLQVGGSVGEIGPPAVLLGRKDSLFFGFAQQSNELEEILHIANANVNADS